MLGRHRPMYFETKRSESRSESRSSSSLQLYNSPPMHAPAALCLIQCRRLQRYAMPPRGHMRYSPRRLAVDEPGALVMADQPYQPGRTWRTGERPGSTVTRPHPVSLGSPRRLGEHNTRALALTISFRATLSGPDARMAATHSHTPTSTYAARHPPPPVKTSSKDRVGSVPSVHSRLSQHSLLFRPRPAEADNA